MGSFLQEYGRLVIAMIIASVLASGIFIMKASCDGVLDNKIFDAEAMTYTEKDNPEINSLVSGKAPTLNVKSTLIVEAEKEFKPKDAVNSAYGSTSFSIYTVPSEETNSIASIKKAIVPGKVNVVYPPDFDKEKSGVYIIYFYAKNTTADGLWTKKSCTVYI